VSIPSLTLINEILFIPSCTVRYMSSYTNLSNRSCWFPTSIWQLGGKCNLKCYCPYVMYLYTVMLSLANSSHYPLPTLSGVGTTCFHHVVIKIRQLFLRPAACLTSTLLETGVGAYDCKCSRDLRLNMPSCTEELEIISFRHSSYDWLLRKLLSFSDRTQSSDRGAIELLSLAKAMYNTKYIDLKLILR
jgi:hypothetical protein